MTAVADAPTAAGAREEASAVRARFHEDVTGIVEAATAPLGRVYVGWTAAVDTAVCPVKYRAGGEHGWEFPGWSPLLAAGAVGRAALVHHLWVHHRPGSPAPSPAAAVPLADPVDVVRAWMRDTAAGRARAPVGDWIVEQSQAGDRAVLAATAATASRWLGGFVRVVGWPLPEGLGIVCDDSDNPVGLRWPKRYRLGDVRTSGITVASSPDAVLGRVSPAGGHTLVVHRPMNRSDTELGDRAAFEAVAATLTTGVVPAEVMFTNGDTGDKVRFPLDAALLEHGIDEITEVVRQRALAARPPEPDEDESADATPSPACHHCDNLDRCPPGQSWIEGPGRWRAGLPTTPP